jgi:3'(2'), 5'-bisphosphate nucleotidase
LRRHFVDVAIDLAIAAGRAALRHYEGNVAFASKADGSPLTRADCESHKTIARGLSSLTPEIPLLSEESSPSEVHSRRSWTRFWLVDPLDGTKEFLKKTGEFTVNIALVEEGEPVLGVLHLPVTGVTYFASKTGGAHVLRGGGPARLITARPLVPHEVVVLASRDHAGPELEAILARVPRARREAAGSALKFGVLAEGGADLYVRTRPTMEWDTAAGQCVLEAAGGRVTDFSGRRLTYNKESLVNPPFVAWGDSGIDWPGRLDLASS